MRNIIQNNNNFNDDFLNLYSEDLADPELEFKSNLRNKMIKKYRGHYSFLEFFHLRNYKFLAIIFMFVFGLMVIGIAEFISLNKVSISSTTTFLNDKEKKDLLENIIKNNVISATGNTNNISAQLLQNQIKTNNDFKLTTQDKYNYIYKKTTFTTGNVKDTCISDSSFYSNNSTIESYEYFGEQNHYYKYLIKDKNNKLISYYLSLTTGSNNEIIKYNGGDNAFKYLTNAKLIPLSFPISYNNSSIPNVLMDNTYSKELSNYFGGEINITKDLQPLENDNYILERKISINCNNSADLTLSYPLSYSNLDNINSKDTKLVIYKDWINSKTFEVVKSQVYINQINDNNLLGDFNTTLTKQELAPKDILNTFTFELNIPIKLISNL